MKKNILLLIILLLCFGCSSNYELKINDDLSVEESIIGLEEEKFYSLFNSSKSDVINSVISPQREYLNNQKYNFEEIEKDGLYGASASKKYDSLKDFQKSSNTYFPYYNSFNIYEESGIITISLTDKIIADNFSNRYIVDDGTISIILPFKVIEHNADKYDQMNNKYTWNFNSENDKDIFIKFDKNKKNINYYNFIIIGGVVVLIFVILCVGIKIINKMIYRNNF